MIPLLIILSISLLISDVRGAGHGHHHQNGAEASNTDHHDELTFHYIGKRDMQVDGNTFFLENDRFGDIQAKKALTLPAENKINYFELVLEAKGNEASPFFIELSTNLKIKSFEFDGPKDSKANDIFGCCLYHHSGKFYVFYSKKTNGKENILKVNELNANDMTQIQKQNGSGIFPRITLQGQGTKVKMQKGIPPTAAKLNERIGGHSATAVGSSHGHGHGPTNKHEDNVDSEEMMAHKIENSMWS